MIIILGYGMAVARRRRHALEGEMGDTLIKEGVQVRLYAIHPVAAHACRAI